MGVRKKFAVEEGGWHETTQWGSIRWISLKENNLREECRPEQLTKWIFTK